MSVPKELQYVHFSHLTVSRDAPRRDDVGCLSPLKCSLLARGVEEPIGVRKIDETAFLVINGRGYRRFLAIRELVAEGHDVKFRKIPVHIQREGGSIDDALSLLVSDIREPMTAGGKAAAIQLIMGAGVSLPQIATMTGIAVGELQAALDQGGTANDCTVWQPATDAKASPAGPRQRFDELFAYAAQLPTGQRERVSEMLAMLTEFVDGRIDANEAVLRLAQPKLVPVC